MADWEVIMEKGVKFLTRFLSDQQDRAVDLLSRTSDEKFKKIFDNRQDKAEGTRRTIEKAAEKRRWKG